MQTRAGYLDMQRLKSQIATASPNLKVTPAFEVRFLVDNVFNKQPPFPALAGTGGNFVNSTTTYFSGIIGRPICLLARKTTRIRCDEIRLPRAGVV